MKSGFLVLITTLFFLFLSCSRKNESDRKPAVHFDPSWESLARHEEAPLWYQDAKFGLYLHWGVYSVPEFGSEWYPRWMHFDFKDEYKHHIEKYGHPSEFGYHDFAPLFTAEFFDPEEWATLFKESGAKFAGLVAEHHDGFSMWDSELTPWNTMDKGPGRDILGELKEACEGEELKFITTFHHSRHLQRYWDSLEFELKADKDPGWKFWHSHYPLFPGMPTMSKDGELAQLYGNMEEELWLEEMWFGKLKEVIDRYQPDIIYFDVWLDQIPEIYRQRFCAYYLNEAQKWGKEVVITSKDHDLPVEVSVEDLEKTRKNRLEEKPWMTDETLSMGSWSYTSDLRIKPFQDVLHVLIDIVSKNGILLLNISPRADGIIPENQQEVLKAMGGWLKKYGQSIYGTRPWYTYGEGPVKEPEGKFENHQEFLKLKYSYKDIRYTTNGNDIYAFLLGAPPLNEALVLRAFSGSPEVDVRDVELLGSSKKIAWERTPEGLSIIIPQELPDTIAPVFRIKVKEE